MIRRTVVSSSAECFSRFFPEIQLDITGDCAIIVLIKYQYGDHVSIDSPEGAYPIPMTRKYRSSGNFVSRTIVGETVLVPVGEQTKKLNGFATFSETGQFLWELLTKEACTEDALADRLAAEYGVPAEQVQPDVRAFLEKMLKNGMIEQC